MLNEKIVNCKCESCGKSFQVIQVTSIFKNEIDNNIKEIPCYECELKKSF